MKIDDKLIRVNKALNHFTEIGEIPTVKKISKFLNITSQNFYSVYSSYTDYVNSCIDTIKYTIISEQIKTKDKNYTLLEVHKSTKSSQHLLLQCSNPNHEPFLANKYNFRCSACHTEKLHKNGLLRAQKIAKSKGGQCLSTTYENQLSKLTFKCSNPDHPAWTTTFLNIEYGKSWCRECSKDKRAVVRAKAKLAKKAKR
ncbi:hypothetical protein [Methylovorus glucosotrophus]|uniref:Uncharacterized protein n=1 Tax=Methylovorus glucosotrophus (strain SIP3-4) TaxID=582744 RepID=C6X7X3_METGS|nr:hypothetical protein [Methylovorus glucosotrophus]ACT51300.1 hypothetical protein Msip34_2058 [Methylovorus glucosotrophus SIP3-4]